MARTTKAQLEAKLNNINGRLEEIGHSSRLWHDGGAYGNGPRLYWHKAGDRYNGIETYATGRQRIGLCWEWADAFGSGLYQASKAQDSTPAKETYNGWSNYQTWCVHLWMTNVEAVFNFHTHRAQELLKDNDGDQSAAIAAFADELKAGIEKYSPTADEANVYSDLMQYAMDTADYDEIAETFFTE